jgi:hypothetical protein
MRLRSKVFRDAEEARIPAGAASLFLTIREEIRANEDCRAAVARREYAETLEIPEWKVRSWLKSLYKAGWLIPEKSRSRKYSMVRLGIPQNIPQNIPQKTRKTSIKTIESIPQNIPQKSHTGVSGISVVSSPAFDVSGSGLEKDLKTKSSEPKPARSLSQITITEIEHVKNVILKDLPLYLVDEKLVEVDSTGSPRALSAYRAMRAAYPSVDVMAVIRAAHAWEIANEKRRKINRPRFWNNWARDNQDKGGVFRNGPVTHDRKPDRRVESIAPRELASPVRPRDPTDEEYEANRQEILAAIEERKKREALEREELPV